MLGEKWNSLGRFHIILPTSIKGDGTIDQLLMFGAGEARCCGYESAEAVDEPRPLIHKRVETPPLYSM